MKFMKNHKSMSCAPRKSIFCLLLGASILLDSLSFANAENAAPDAQGKLAFTSVEKEIVLEIGEAKNSTAFEFTNRGDKPIRVVGIKTSCGCTVAEMEKKEYAPGESGALNVHFSASTGTQGKSSSVLVVSDEESNNFYSLKVMASRKQAAQLSTQHEEWKIGSTPDAREILVKINESGTHIVEASSSNDTFDVKMTTVEPGKQYKVTVKPRTSEYPAAATLRFQTTHEKQPYLTARLEIR